MMRACLAAVALLVAAPAGADVRVPDYERVVLPNGMTLVTMVRRDVPLIAFTAFVRGGALADPPDRAGVASLTGALLERGAGSRDAFQFADTVEGAGGSFSAVAGVEAVLVSGQFLARDRDLMVELLADALQRPKFDADEVTRIRDRRVEFIRAAKDTDPSDLIATYGRAFLFAGHPLASPQGGSERSLATITREDVLGFYRAHFGADRTTLVVTGDVDARALRAAVERAFSGWARAAGAAPQVRPAPATTGRRVLLVDQPGSSQTYFWLANVGVARSFPDRAPLDVVNTLYGGRFTSVLNTELRVRTGLTYGASSSFTRGSVPGEFAIVSFTQTASTERALDLAVDTLARLKRDGVPGDVLDSGRTFVRGQFPLRLETASHWASALAELELYGLGRDYIEGYMAAVAAVGEADARRVIASAFPSPDDLVIVLIGDAALIRDVAKKYGPVTEMPLAAPDFRPG
jgi:predicted Zn-dependent peptidase